MAFLNAILLAGVAAFAIPLLIHLLNKRRVVTVRWGAMHLLREVVRQRKRRIKIEQWLLLAVRIAIPIVLALCLARPVVTALKSLGLGKTSFVLLLDDSFSMRAPGPGGSPAERGRQDVAQMLASAPRGSEAQVVMTGGQPRRLLDQPTTALEVLPGELAALPIQAGPAKIDEAFQAAASVLGKATNSAREVAVISDFQQSDWGAAAGGAAVPALEALVKMEPRPQVTFYRLTSDLTENLAIASAELSALVVAEGQPVGLRVRIVNHGKRQWQDVAVHLEADGARLRSSRVSLPAQGEAVIGFAHEFGKAGDHSLAVRLEGDSFPDDNAFYSVVRVRGQVNVLLVDGAASNEPLGGAADFVELALTPHQSASATLKDLIRTTKIDVKKLRPDDLRGKEVVVFTDVDKLHSNRLGELDKFVRSGGGMVVFAGPHCDIEWYNKEFYKKGEGLFPATIKGLMRAPSPATPARIMQQRLTHPAVIYFNDARGGRLQDAEFQTWLQFETPGSDAVKSVLQLDRGSPLLLEKARDRGRVFAVATTADAQWSNLPLQPFFVPLMQRLVTYLATEGAGNEYNRVGTTVRLTLPKERVGAQWTLRDPSGQQQTLVAKTEGERTVVESAPATMPGIYQLSQGSETRLLAFNVDSAESDLTPLPADEVRKLAQRHGADFAESLDGWQKLDRSRRHGSELWQPFLWVLLGLLFVEVLLQQRIARG